MISDGLGCSKVSNLMHIYLRLRKEDWKGAIASFVWIFHIVL